MIKPFAMSTSHGAGHTPRMGSWCVDAKDGSTFATGGWAMMSSVDGEMPIDVPAALKADVVRLCPGGKVPNPQTYD
jgi:hypothetical protein